MARRPSSSRCLTGNVCCTAVPSAIELPPALVAGAKSVLTGGGSRRQAALASGEIGVEENPNGIYIGIRAAVRARTGLQRALWC